MERAKEDAEELRSVVVEGREREERLERELALLGAKLAVAKADNADRSSSRPIREGMHRFPRARNSDGEASVRSVRYNSGSSVVRPTSFVNSIDRELSSSAFPQTPASKVAAAYRERTPSTTSSILAAAYRERIPSMASSTGLGGLGDLTSPLMGQTMAFGPKSSYGSNPSPLKSHGVQQQQPSGLRSPIQKPLLLSSSIARLSRRESKDSLASSDWGEHLPPPSDRPCVSIFSSSLSWD